MFPMPTRSARLKMYMKNGMTEAEARAELKRHDEAVARTGALYRKKLAASTVKSEPGRPGVYRFNPMDDNDPVFKLLCDAAKEANLLGLEEVAPDGK